MPPAPPLAAEHAAQAAAAFEHINDDHPDTVLFVARHLGATDATAAELVTADTVGLDLRVVRADGDGPLRVAFPSPVATVEELQVQLMTILGEARAAAPDGPLTSLEAQFAETTRIPVQVVEVVSRRPVTSDLVEVEVRGGPGLTAPSPDTFYFALVGEHPDVVDETYDIGRHQEQGATDGVRGAYVTIRRLDPATSTAALWVVRHGQGDGVTGWLADAPPGARLGLWGPRTDFDPPADAGSVLLVADETGVAAAAATIERLDGTGRIVAVLEVAGADDHPPLPEHPGLTVRWLHRDGRAAGTGDALLDAVRALDLPGEWWAFGGAESRQITAVRRHLRGELGWPAERVSMTGYWRLGS